MKRGIIDTISELLRRHRTVIGRTATLFFLFLVIVLMVRHGRTIEWSEVGEALTRYRPSALILATIFAWLALAVYSCFDVLSQAYVNWAARVRPSPSAVRSHVLPWYQVQLVAFVSYVFNLNLGALMGGIAFRYRLYSRFGLGNLRITILLGMSVATNWLGYGLVAGGLFASGTLELPDSWKISNITLQGLGMALLAITTSYLAVCLYRGGTVLMLRGHAIVVPPLRLAGLQLLLSSLHWLLMSATIYVLLGQQVSYGMVLGVLLLSAVAGAVTHVPGALGVLEAVFIAMLSHQMPRSELLAALLAYRATFYLSPLLIAALTYIGIEMHGRHHPVAASITD